MESIATIPVVTTSPARGTIRTRVRLMVEYHTTSHSVASPVLTTLHIAGLLIRGLMVQGIVNHPALIDQIGQGIMRDQVVLRDQLALIDQVVLTGHPVLIGHPLLIDPILASSKIMVDTLMARKDSSESFTFSNTSPLASS